MKFDTRAGILFFCLCCHVIMPLAELKEGDDGIIGRHIVLPLCRHAQSYTNVNDDRNGTKNTGTGNGRRLEEGTGMGNVIFPCEGLFTPPPEVNNTL